MKNTVSLLKGKRRISIFLFLVTVLLVISLFPSKATLAATYNSYGSSNPRIQIDPYSYNSTWQRPMDAAVNSWNLSSTPVNIQKYNFVNNKVFASSYSDSWYGLITQWHINNETQRFEIKLNSRTISRDAKNIYWFIKSVLVHEFGHVFYLADNPGTGNSSIMNHNRDRNTLTNPTSTDIRNVNNKY